MRISSQRCNGIRKAVYAVQLVLGVASLDHCYRYVCCRPMIFMMLLCDTATNRARAERGSRLPSRRTERVFFQEFSKDFSACNIWFFDFLRKILKKNEGERFKSC
ncbi:MAG: hypothetical protein ACK53Y_09400, partial [bacterium]